MRSSFELSSCAIFFIRCCFLIALLSASGLASAQEEPAVTVSDTSELFVIIKNDGARFVGYILKRDEREVLIETKDRGRVIIPTHEIRSIQAVQRKETNTSPGTYTGEDPFYAHYLYNTGAFPLKKDQSYMVFSWYGVDYHLGLTNRLGIGLTSTWWGSPMIGNVKYSIPLAKNVSLAIGGMIGSGTYIWPEVVVGVPYAGLSMGSTKLNLSMTYGYACIFEASAPTLYRRAYSIGGMAKLTKSFALVFDSMVLPTTETTDEQGNPRMLESFSGFSPSFRWQLKSGSALQAGICGLRDGDETIAFPTIQYIRRLE